MTTIVNNPAPTNEGSNPTGLILGIVILLAILGLLYFYGLPAFRNASSGTQINVPDKVDVNINQGGNGGDTAPQQ